MCVCVYVCVCVHVYIHTYTHARNKSLHAIQTRPQTTMTHTEKLCHPQASSAT